jgi:hypothetical protein
LAITINLITEDLGLEINESIQNVYSIIE